MDRKVEKNARPMEPIGGMSLVRGADRPPLLNETIPAAFARTVGYLEGVDLSRIETNRSSNIAAGESQKAAAKQGYLSTVAIAENQRNASFISAGLGLVGSGLQIGGDYYKEQQYLKTLGNPRPYTTMPTLMRPSYSAPTTVLPQVRGFPG